MIYANLYLIDYFFNFTEVHKTQENVTRFRLELAQGKPSTCVVDSWSLLSLSVLPDSLCDVEIRALCSGYLLSVAGIPVLVA